MGVVAPTGIHKNFKKTSQGDKKGPIRPDILIDMSDNVDSSILTYIERFTPSHPPYNTHHSTQVAWNQRYHNF